MRCLSSCTSRPSPAPQNYLMWWSPRTLVALPTNRRCSDSGEGKWAEERRMEVGVCGITAVVRWRICKIIQLMDGDIIGNQTYPCYLPAVIPASSQFASLFFFKLLIFSTSHAVLLLHFALKHHPAEIFWVKKLVWKVCMCVIVSIIINILQKVKA